MRIMCISDTHTFHKWISPPDDIDMIIHSGDCSNPRDIHDSKKEINDFIDWYGSLKVKYKVFVPGNHDLAVERKKITPADFAAKGIIYLEDAATTIEGLKIYGSPWTPSFGTGWAFNRKRDKLHLDWEKIPEDTDILVVHGPPYGILDLSRDWENNLEHCGCSALRKRVERLNLKLCTFGHIHNGHDNTNAGVFYNGRTYFVNASLVMDGRFDRGLHSQGVVIDINDEKKIVGLEVLM